MPIFEDDPLVLSNEELKQGVPLLAEAVRDAINQGFVSSAIPFLGSIASAVMSGVALQKFQQNAAVAVDALTKRLLEIEKQNISAEHKATEVHAAITEDVERLLQEQQALLLGQLLERGQILPPKRQLSEAQILIMTQLLTENEKGTIEVEAISKDDRESNDYANAISRVFQGAGWTLKLQTGVVLRSGEPPRGINVAGDHTLYNQTIFVHSVLKAAGIEAGYRIYRRPPASGPWVARTGNTIEVGLRY